MHTQRRPSQKSVLPFSRYVKQGVVKWGPRGAGLHQYLKQQKRVSFLQTHIQGSFLSGNNAQDKGPWRLPCQLKKSFKGLRRRWGSCWEEGKRKYFSDEGSLICPPGILPIWPPNIWLLVTSLMLKHCLGMAAVSFRGCCGCYILCIFVFLLFAPAYFAWSTCCYFFWCSFASKFKTKVHAQAGLQNIRSHSMRRSAVLGYKTALFSYLNLGL